MNPSKSEKKKKNDAQNSINSGAWSNNEDEDDASSQVQFRRSKSLSRTKKVKKYLSKKLKDPLVAAVEDKVNRSSWYVSQDKTNENPGPVEMSCDTSSQNDCVTCTESGAKHNTARSRCSWYVDQEKWVDIKCDSTDNAEEVVPDVLQTEILECNKKAPSKHVSRSSLVESPSQDFFNNLQTIQIRKIKQSKSEDGSFPTFERRSSTYKSLDNRSREKRLSNPFDIFQRHSALSLHKKSKENFVIDRNKLESSIEQLTALKSQLNSGCPHVPFLKCDTKVQRVPLASSTKSKSSLVHKKSILKQSKSSEYIPKISQECDLLNIPSQPSKESIPQAKPSYSDVLKTDITTALVTDLDVPVELVSNSAGIDNIVTTACDMLDDHHMVISEDSGIVDPLSLTEDCSERISLSEEFSLSSEDLVSCIDFLDLNTETIAPPPCSSLSSNASFNSSLETVISASNNTLEDEEDEYVTKVPSFMKVRSMIFSTLKGWLGYCLHNVTCTLQIYCLLFWFPYDRVQNYILLQLTTESLNKTKLFSGERSSPSSMWL